MRVDRDTSLKLPSTTEDSASPADQEQLSFLEGSDPRADLSTSRYNEEERLHIAMLSKELEAPKNAGYTTQRVLRAQDKLESFVSSRILRPIIGKKALRKLKSFIRGTRHDFIRLNDMAISGSALLFAEPAIWLLSKAILKEDPSKPAIFEQTRVGQGGKPFKIFKLRTMNGDGSFKGQPKEGELDPRITKIGEKLRKTRLDELPQLRNIWKGDMSFVGARPLVPDEVVDDAAHALRHHYKPGLLGISQLNGNASTGAQRVIKDVHMIRDMSVLGYYGVLFATAKKYVMVMAKKDDLKISRPSSSDAEINLANIDPEKLTVIEVDQPESTNLNQAKN